MELTGSQKEQFRDALCAAFNADTLEQMVRFKLGMKLYDKVPQGPLETVAFKLIEWAEEEGFTEALIRAALLTRKNNPKVRAFLDDHFPRLKDPVTAERLAQAAQGGFQATVRLLFDPGIQRIVGRFRADFQTTRTHVRELGKYKALHDRLHRLQMGFLKPLIDCVERSLPGQPPAHPLDLYAFQIRRETEPAGEDAAGLPNEPEEQRWIKRLAEVADQVDQANRAKDPAVLRQALVQFRRAIGETPRINSSLANTAARLGLKKLIEAMTEIRDALVAGSGRQNGGQALQEVREGISGLQVLRPRLDGLVEEHFAWQFLDKEFTASDAESGSTLQERFPLWTEVHTELARLCNLSPEKDWAMFLTRLVEELAAASDAGDKAQFAERFLALRTVAGDRFREVDVELLRLSEQLARWADPIDMLVRLATDDQHN